jgi:phosphoribosylglycinamide formyltransferase-1
MKLGTIRRGIIGSSNGSSIRAASECIRTAGYDVAWTVITDRDCGLGRWAKERDYEFHQIAYGSPYQFSTEAQSLFHQAGCEDVLLYYTRRVTSPLIDGERVWNIHPSLLPAFPGLHGVEDAVLARAKLIGASLHRVDEGLDTGPIEAQVASPISRDMTMEQINFFSFLQKVWLTLVWFEQTNGRMSEKCGGGICPAIMACSPMLLDQDLLRSYADWVEKLTGELN